jgi:hypothetical protein
MAQLVNHALLAVTGARGNFTPWNVGDVPSDDIEDLLRLVEKRRWYDELESKKD